MRVCGRGGWRSWERELLEVNGNAERLARSFSELVELQLVLEKASAFFDDAQHRASTATFQAQPADTGSESPAVACPPSSVPLLIPSRAEKCSSWKLPLFMLDIASL